MPKFKFVDDYRGAKMKFFPDEDNISQSDREKEEYFLYCAQAIVSKYVSNKSAIPYDSYPEGYRTFQELRAYRYGKNTPNKYKDILIGRAQGNNGERKTTLNISWDILQILPQKMDVVMGYLQKINYEVTTEATDYQALMSKKQMVSMAKIVADDRMRLLQQDTNELAGRPVIPMDEESQTVGGMKFNNPKEVEMASAVGVFFLEQEAAIKILLDKTMYDSGWDGISDKLKDDFCTLGFAITIAETNQNTNIVEDDYVDPDMAMIPWSVYNDYRDMTWGGRVKKTTIAELRKKLKITEAELVKIAKMYASDDFSNLQPNFYGNIYSQRNGDSFGMTMMDQILVDVADVRWIGKKDVKITSVNREKDGVFIVNKVKSEYKLSDREAKKGKKVDDYSNCTVYKAKLVLGTGCIFDFGEDNDISYSKNSLGKMYPVFPIKAVRTNGSSLVERCIGFVDDACLANFKLRVARMKMPAPPNLMVKKSALENVKIGNVDMKPTQLMKLLQDEGFFIYDDQNGWGNQATGGAPISTVPTDVIKQLLEWRSDIEWNISMIEKVTGVNDIFSAQTPERQQGLGVSNLMVQAVDNALTPIVKAYEYSFEQTMRINAKKWQVVSTYMSDEQRKRLSINRALQVVEIGSDLNSFDFDIRIEAGATQAERQQLLTDLNNMKAAKRQGGQIGLNESDFLLISSLINKGDIKKAQLLLAQILDARQKEAQAEQERMIQLNGQQQQESAQVTSQAKQQEIQLQGQVKTDTELQSIQAQGQVDMQLEQFRARAKMNEIAMQNVYGNQNQNKSA